MNIRYAFWKGVDKLKQRFKKAPKPKPLPPAEKFSMKAGEPKDDYFDMSEIPYIPMVGKKRVHEPSKTSGAARRRARAAKAKRNIKKARNRQKRRS